jgi:hypothetical protein
MTAQRAPRPARRDYAIDDKPLPIARLAAIKQSLPERERFPFMLRLGESDFDELLQFEHRSTTGGTKHGL